jgi:hypothetical protein
LLVAGERMSSPLMASPACSRIVMTGSLLIMASMEPARIAATAPAEVPTPITDTSDGSSPFFDRM